MELEFDLDDAIGDIPRPNQSSSFLHLVGGDGTARQPGAIDRALPLLYPLLRRAAMVVEGHDTLGRPPAAGAPAGVIAHLHGVVGEVVVRYAMSSR